MRRVALALLLAGALLAAGCRKGKTDWRVQSLLGGRTHVLAVTEPQEVRAFRLVDAQERSDVGPYRIEGATHVVAPDVAARLSRVFLDGETYDWQRQDPNVWTPKVGLSFLRNGMRLDIALCLETDQMIVFRDGVYVGCEDTTDARRELVTALRDALPGDAYLAQQTVPDATDDGAR